MGRHVHIFCVIAQLLLQAQDVLCLQSSEGRRRHVRCPSMFVAVVSSSENHERRNEIRSMWQDSASGQFYGNQLMYKYAVCTGGQITRDLQKEQDKHGDLMLMTDCEEGYLNGTLTRKVAQAMRSYVQNYPWLELFMKIDDDAYLSTNRLCNFMDNQKADMHSSYIGVFAEQNEKMQRHLVIRDPTSDWFEPKEKYPFETYPVSAKGGPGYILPFKSVKEIVTANIDKKYELNNEDKAVGYWVTKLKWAKIQHTLNLRGTDGYEEHELQTTGTFKEFPFIVHHHLEGAVISCLHEVEAIKNPEATIDHCFKTNLFGKRNEHVRIHMP